MNRTIEAILKLSAKLGSTAAFGQMAGKLAMVDKQAKAFNRTQGLMARNAGFAASAIGRLIAPAAIAYGTTRAVKNYANLERAINRIGITADASAAETRAAMEAVQSAAQQYALPIDEAVAGLESLVASGKNLKEAMAFLPSVLATAQASGSAVADIATTADAMSSSLGISADRMTAAFDILAAAGKAGKFELRDMAAELPSLAPAFAALGYTGEAGLKKLAAAAQTVRIQTGSSAEAATALQNVFQKMEASQTVSNFAKFGVDLRKEMAKARAEGKDVLDTFIRLSQVATKGDLAKLPQLFSDMQLLQGMRALMTGAEGMERLVAALGKADGTVLQDLNRVLGDTESKIQKLKTSWDKFLTSLGGAVVDSGGGGALDWMSDRIESGSKIDAAKKDRGGNVVSPERFKTYDIRTARKMLAFEAGHWPDRDRALPALDYPTAAPSFDTPIPIPTPRPTGPQAVWRRSDPLTGGMDFGDKRQNERTARAAAMDAGGWANEADKVTQALTTGGDKAGQAVESGVAQGGDQAARAMADAIRQAGADAAAKISAAVAGAAARLRFAEQPVRANRGRSGPEYEAMP